MLTRRGIKAVCMICCVEMGHRGFCGSYQSSRNLGVEADWGIASLLAAQSHHRSKHITCTTHKLSSLRQMKHLQPLQWLRVQTCSAATGMGHQWQSDHTMQMHFSTHLILCHGTDKSSMSAHSNDCYHLHRHGHSSLAVGVAEQAVSSPVQLS